MLLSPLAEALPPHVRSQGWLGFPSASDENIAATESRLGIALPPSYRDFLKVSDGWLKPTHAIHRLLSVDKITWFKAKNRNWIKAFTQPAMFNLEPKIPDQDYFAYGQFAQQFRAPHLKETLQISEVGDAAVYLLNPQVITQDGEWEAWFFADWLPGVHRFRSFQEMMESQYAQLARTDWQQPICVQHPLPNEYVGSPGSAKRRVKPRRMPTEKKILGKRFSQWSVDELLAMLANEEYGVIHDEVLQGLALLGDRRAIAPILEKVREGDFHAMQAMKVLDPEALREPLLELLQSQHLLGFGAAADLLAEMREFRAIPLIVKAVVDLSLSLDYAANSLAGFGAAGADALIGLLQHENIQVRRRALGAMLYTTGSKATEAIRWMLADPDEQIRESAKLILKVLPTIPRHM